MIVKAERLSSLAFRLGLHASAADVREGTECSHGIYRFFIYDPRLSWRRAPAFSLFQWSGSVEGRWALTFWDRSQIRTKRRQMALKTRVCDTGAAGDAYVSSHR